MRSSHQDFDRSLADRGEEARGDKIGGCAWIAAVTIASQPLVEFANPASSLCRFERQPNLF